MGDTQSAQREDRKDGGAEEEDAQTQQDTEDKPLTNNGQISEIGGKAGGSLAAFNGHSEDEVAAEALLSPDEHVANTEAPPNEPDEADAPEEAPEEMMEMEAKQNDINESFRRFFSNIGLKLTVKRGSATQVPEEGPNEEEDGEGAAKNIGSENAEEITDTAQEAHDNDSTTCPTLTDGTSEDFLENAEEKKTSSKEEEESDDAPAGTPEEEAHATCGPGEEVEASPFKRFFTTGIFSGLRKKKKLSEDKTAEKELVDMGKQAVQDEQGEDISPGEEAATAEAEPREIELQEMIPPAASSQVNISKAKPRSTDPSDIIVKEPEILSNQENHKVPASPLKRLLSGSSLKRLSKKPRSRRSSDAKLSDSGERTSDQLLSSAESADNQKEESAAEASGEASGEEDSAWASFKKLMTPKKRTRRSSSGHEEAQIPGSVDEAKPSEGEQMSDQSTEEGKKRKDSSVSWEAVLCGSGRRRSRRTSDSEDDWPRNDSGDNKQGNVAKQAAESSLESSNEAHETLVSSPEQAGSSPQSGEGSTWKSFKKLVTPKRKAKSEDETKDQVLSDSDVAHDDSLFSMKNLLPGRKKRKSAEASDQASSDEADKEVASGDEDSETPAVVPLSEFDAAETWLQIQTQADVESYASKQAAENLQEDLMDEVPALVLPCDTEAKKDQSNETASENEASANEESEDASDLISKHQQLSDIPEEGVVTDTMATPASAAEEAARDDTIADDLMEITSEAITAPEPVDLTQADETEMISAVSQLSESSKTSGNTTPVPAEYDAKDTELLLEQVAGTISTSPEEVRSEEQASERISSASHQTPGTFEEQPKLPETRRRLDAASINSDLIAEAADVINRLAAAQSESASDANQAISTEVITEASTEEFDTAELTVDDDYDYEVDASQSDQSFEEFEATDEGQHLAGGVCEEQEAVMLPEEEEAGPEQAENEISKTDSEETESAPTVVDEPEDGAMKQKVHFLVEEEDQLLHDVTEQGEDHLPEVEDEQEALAAAETAALASQTGHVQSPEMEVPSSEDRDTDGLKQTAEHLTDVTAEPEKEEPQVGGPKMDKSEATDVTEAVQAATSDSGEGGVQSEGEPSEDVQPVEAVKDEPREETAAPTEGEDASQTQQLLDDAATLHSEALPEKQVMSEDAPPADTVKDEPREEAAPHSDVSVEPTDASKAEHVQEPEELQDAQAATLHSEAGGPESPEKEVMSEDAPAEEAAPLTEVNVEQVDASKAEHVQEPDVLEDAQAATPDSEEGGVQSLHKELSEDAQPTEAVKDEPREEAAPHSEVSVEPTDASKTEHVQEPEELQDAQAATLPSEAGGPESPEEQVESEDAPAEEAAPLTDAEDVSKADQVQEPEVLEDAQAATLDSEEGGVQSLGVIPEDAPPADTVDEEAAPPTEVHVEPVDAPKTDQGQEPEGLQVVQAATLDSEEGGVQSPEQEVTPEDAPPADTVKDEPREEAAPHSDVSVEQVDAPKADHVQEPEVSEDAQAATPDSEEGGVQSLGVIPEDAPPADTVEEEAAPPTKVNVEPVDADPSEDVQPVEAVKDEPGEETAAPTEGEDAPQTEHVQPDVLQAAATSHTEAGGAQSLGKDVISEDVTVETVPEEPEQTAGVSVEPQVLQAAQATTLHSEAGSVQLPEEEVMSEDVQAEEAVTDEPKLETGPPAEVNVEPAGASKTEHVHEPGALQAVQAATSDSGAGRTQLPEEEVMSEDAPAEEAAPLTDAEDVSKADQVQEPEVLQVVRAATLDSEEGGVQSPEQEVTPEDAPPADAVKDEPNLEAAPLTEVSVEQVDAPKTEHVQEPDVLQAATTSQSEAGGAQSLGKDVISEDVTVETVPEEPEQTAGVSVEPEEPTVEPQVSPADVTVTDTVTVTVTETESAPSVEDVPEPAPDRATASAADGAEDTDVALQGQALEINQETKSVEQDAQAEHEGGSTETVGELQTLTAVHVHAVYKDVRSVQVLEKTVFSGESSAPYEDNANVSDEPTHEVHLSSVQVSVGGEKEDELPDAEIDTAAAECAVETQVTTCDLQDASAAIPAVSIETTSQVYEPSIDRIANETEFNETVERDSVFVMMHVPSVQLENNHSIRLQAVDVDVESAENITDTVVEVGVTEAKEVIDVCHETIKVENVSATAETEEEVVNEGDKVTIQEVIQHVKDNLPETAPEQEAVRVEQDVLKQPDESESKEVEDQQVMKDEGPVVISENSASQTSDVPGSLDVSVQDGTEDVEETTADVDKSENHVTAEDATCSSEEGNAMEAQTRQTAQSHTVTSSDAGVISSAGNVASPSDVSGVGVRAEGEPVHRTQRAEDEEATELPEATVQATAGNLLSTERAVVSTEPVLQDVSMQAVQTTEPAERGTLTEQAAQVLLNQPVLFEAPDEETKAEDNDQDVWLDAEEDVNTQEGVWVEQPGEQEEGPFGVEPTSKTEKQARQQEMHETEEACDMESDGEEFAVALEHPEMATANVSTVGWHEFDSI